MLRWKLTMRLQGEDIDVLSELKRGSTVEVLLRWMVDYMWLGPVLALLYLVGVFAGRSWMKDRKPYHLRRELVLWNACQSLISIMGLVGTTPLMLAKWREVGVVGSVCSPLHDDTTTFWLAVFTLLKVVEYGDTVFIVLRKSPLMFLHWYHHITVSLFTWFNAGRITDSIGLWFAWMNIVVHSVMYTYYMIKASGVRLPKFVSQTVTVLQICQFVTGLACNLYAVWRYLNGYQCYTSRAFLSFSLALYGSYLVLFLLFFFDRYIRKPKPKSHKD